MKQTARLHDKQNRPSAAFWDAVRSRLGLKADAQVARLMGRDRAVVTRARGKLTPLQGISGEAQQRLLEELAKTFTHADSLQAWLTKIGWPLTSDQSEWIDRHFRRQSKLRFMRLLPDTYEPRPALEAQILPHLRPRDIPAEQKLSVRSGVVLTGVRGQGKTTHALGTLRAHSALENEFPDGVYFLECHRQTTDQCLDLLAVELGLDLMGLSAEQRWSLLQKHVKGTALLVVLDDLEDAATLRRFYTLLGSCIDSRLLVTTYQHFSTQELAGLRLLQLDVPDLTLPEAERLTERMLHQPLAPAERVSFERLIHRLNGHPLALTILIGLKDDAQSTWAHLLNAVEQAPLAALEYPDATDKEGSVRLCFELVYQRLMERHPQAAEIFRAMGVFAAARSTVALLCEVAALTADVETTLQKLARYQLLSITHLAGEQRVWHAHRLLQAFAVLKLHERLEEEQACQRRYLSALTAVLRELRARYKQEPVAYADVQAVREEILHAVELASQLEDQNEFVALFDGSTTLLLLAGQVEPLAALLERLMATEGSSAKLFPWFGGLRGEMELARQQPQQALTYFGQVLQFDLPLLYEIRWLLATAACYRRIDRLDAAEKLVIKANTTAAQNSVQTTPELWAAINAEQAEVAMARGRFDSALKNFVLAEEAYGRAGWSLNVALIRTSRAACLLDLNRPTEALAVLEHARSFFGTQHWPLGYTEAVALNCFYAYLLQRNYTAAQAELDRWEQTLNDFTSDTWPHLHAKLWQWRGALAEAQQQFELALTCYQKSLALWQQVPASESTQEIVRERIAITQSRTHTGSDLMK